MKKNNILLFVGIAVFVFGFQNLYADYIITTIAGTGSSGYSGDGGNATSAQLYYPRRVAIDSSGNVYIADYNNHRIRKVNTSGTITTFAGTGSWGYSGDDGNATSAQLYYPYGVSVDDSDNVYIADKYNHRIRKVNTSGIISTIAGTGSSGYSGDGGSATSAQFNHPTGVAVDSSGNVYIADQYNHCIRKVYTSGTITTIAGTGTGGYSGDGGSATLAQLYNPNGVAIDSSGNVYIADRDNYRIRKVNTSGTITTIAGTGTQGYSGDGGNATSAQFYYPFGVAIDSSGNIYITDSYNNRIRKVDTSGIITTIAGTGSSGYSGDGGNATSAQLNYPRGVAVDSSGNVYIADHSNHRIRKLTDSGSESGDSYEPNDSFSAAYTISKDTTIYAYIWDSTDKDYYKFYITRAGTVTINLTNLPADYELKLYNSSQSQIGSSTGVSDESITKYLSSVSAYYVYVYGYSDAFSFDETYCLSLSFAEDTIPMQNLVGWWQFNDGPGSTTADSSGNGNFGLIYGGAGWVDGKYDGGLEFDGSDDYVDAGASFNITGNFTLGAWIKTDSTWDTRNIITKGDNAYGIQLENNNAVKFYCSGGSLQTSDNSVSNNVWAHVAVVYTGSQMKIYINGTEKQSTSFYSNPQLTSETLKIGRHASGSFQYFSGCIDEVFVYSRALSADDIAALYPGEAAGGSATDITIGSNLIRRGSSDYTIIRTNVSQPGYLTVTIYDLAGKKVKRWSQYVDGSNRSFEWPKEGERGIYLPHGIYCIKVEGMGITEVRPIVIK